MTVPFRDSGYFIPLAGEQLAELLQRCQSALDYKHFDAHLPVKHTCAAPPTPIFYEFESCGKKNPSDRSSSSPTLPSKPLRMEGEEPSSGQSVQTGMSSTKVKDSSSSTRVGLHSAK